MSRVRTHPEVETAILVNCGRRCALCVGLLGDHGVKKGQIAHIDRNPSNSSYQNLAFLCIPHHDEYDSVSRQSKNLKPSELQHYKKVVCATYSPDYTTIKRLLSDHANALLSLLNEDEQLAVEVDKELYKDYCRLYEDMVNLIHNLYVADVRQLLQNVQGFMHYILSTISDFYYIESGWRRKFDNSVYPQEVLAEKKQAISNALIGMGSAYQTLRNFLDA